MAQNVGIGTATPQPTAKLHIDLGTSLTDGFLVTGNSGPIGTGSVPDLGAGSRMMFYPAKAAFRAGITTGQNWNNVNVGMYSAAFGTGTKASGVASFAAGAGATASGDEALSIGYYTQAPGLSAVALGEQTSAYGYAATTLGYYTTAMGQGSTALGLNTNAKSYGSVAMGRFNEPFATSDATTWVDTDPLLILGNGTSGTARKNALVVYKNGNTEINGYTQLGEAAPAIKMKKITGTGPAVDNNMMVATGLDGSKILSVSILMQYGTTPLATRTVPPNYTTVGLEYRYSINFSTIEIVNQIGNSANIGSKPFRMLIMYEE